MSSGCGLAGLIGDSNENVNGAMVTVKGGSVERWMLAQTRGTPKIECVLHARIPSLTRTGFAIKLSIVRLPPWSPGKHDERY